MSWLFLAVGSVASSVHERTRAYDAALMFLRNKGLEAARLDAPADIVAREAGYYRLVTSDAILRVFDGQVQPVAWTDDQFLIETAGAPLDRILSLVDPPQAP
jgi:hypothetical protein